MASIVGADMQRLTIAAIESQRHPVTEQWKYHVERTPGRPLALGGRDRSQGRFLFQPPCGLLFEPVDEPSPGGPRGAARSIHGRHRDDVAFKRCGLARDLNERTACQVRLDHVKRHEAKSKS